MDTLPPSSSMLVSFMYRYCRPINEVSIRKNLILCDVFFARIVGGLVDCLRVLDFQNDESVLDRSPSISDTYLEAGCPTVLDRLPAGVTTAAAHGSG